jgi:hypothetical protein
MLSVSRIEVEVFEGLSLGGTWLAWKEEEA